MVQVSTLMNGSCFIVKLVPAVCHTHGPLSKLAKVLLSMLARVLLNGILG